MEQDKKAAALLVAQEKAKEQEDRRNAVALTPKETLTIVKKVGELTKIVESGDAATDKAAKEKGLEAARKYMADEKASMDRLRKTANA